MATTDKPPRQPDESQLLQSGRPRQRDDPRPRADVPRRLFTPVDATLIPTGEIRPSRARRSISAAHAARRSGSTRPRQTRRATTTTSCSTAGRPMKLAAPASSTPRRRVMECRTTEPGVQFYTGNFLDGKSPATRATPTAKYGGFCLETQHFPDSINHPTFPPWSSRRADLHTTTVSSSRRSSPRSTEGRCAK